MKTLVPTKQEVADAISRLSALNPGTDYPAKIKEAIEKDGYKHEKCPKCKVTFLACIHFIQCAAEDCPMKGEDKRSLLQCLLDASKEDKSA